MKKIKKNGLPHNLTVTKMTGNSETVKFSTETFENIRSGFTLVELVITIAIVIILSVISVPIYRGYVDKAKMSEGYALRGLILSAQKAYYSEYGNFYKSANTGASESNYDTYKSSFDPVLGIDARGNKYFTTFSLNFASDPKNYFDAMIKIPEDLKLSLGISKKYLGVIYDMSDTSNVTVKFYEAN